MVLILVEPSYSRSIWCLNLLDGLTGEFKQKRVPFRQIASLDEAGPDDRYIYLIGSDNAWVRAALAGLQPDRDLSHPAVQPGLPHIRRGLQHRLQRRDQLHAPLVELLRGRGTAASPCTAVNPQSVSDESRMDSYLAALGGEDGRRHVFFNSGSLENCFEQFMARAQQYDAVICANDFAAISLVRRLGLAGPGPAGKAGHRRLRRRAAYPAVRQPYPVGAGELCRVRPGRGDPAGKSAQKPLSVPHHHDDPLGFQPAGRGPRRPPRRAHRREKAPALPADPDIFYEDRELNDMMLLEKLLDGCEDPDYDIIRLLLRGEPYEKIAETCFLTESAIKYRVKKMVRVCCVPGRKELTDLLRRYLPGGDPGGPPGVRPGMR